MPGPGGMAGIGKSSDFDLGGACMKITYWKLACILILVLTVLAACGSSSNGEDEQELNDGGPTPPPYQEGGIRPRDPLGVPDAVLRVAAHPMSEWAIRQAAESLIEDLWNQQGFELYVEVTTHITGNFTYNSPGDTFRGFVPEQTFHRFNGDITNYDLLHMYDLRSLVEFAQQGYLVELYTLIDSDPTAHRGDFFTDVLDAFLLDGNLYTMPLGFYLEFVGINTTLNERHVIEQFASHNGITLVELFNIYHQLRANIASEGSNRNYTGTLDGTHRGRYMFPLSMPQQYLMAHFTAHYRDDLVEYMDMFNAIFNYYTFTYPFFTNHGGRSFNHRMIDLLFRSGAERFESEQSAFIITNRPYWREDGNGAHVVQAMLSTGFNHYRHFTPLVIPSGALTVHPVNDGMLAINSLGQVDLAWELLKRIPVALLTHTAQEPGTMFHDACPSWYIPIPIIRHGLEANLRANVWRVLEVSAWGFRDAFNHSHYGQFWPLGRLTTETVERLLGYLDRGQAVTHFPPPTTGVPWYWVQHFYSEAMRDFQSSAITAEDAARLILGEVDAWPWWYGRDR